MKIYIVYEYGIAPHNVERQADVRAKGQELKKKKKLTNKEEKKKKNA